MPQLIIIYYSHFLFLKYLLLNFSGSDWCGWCKLMDQKVFGPEVASWLSFHEDLGDDFPSFRHLQEYFEEVAARLPRAAFTKLL